MQRSLKHIIGYAINGLDGEIGKVSDFLFDDEVWIVRYLVAGSGKWLPGRQVLVSPADVRSVEWLKSVINIDRTKEEIKNSPPIESDKPVSRQKEEELSRFFAWPTYWAVATPGAVPGAAIATSLGRQPDLKKKPVEGDPHLRSIREVTGYHVVTADGQMGHIEDFIVEDGAWTIRYLVVDTANWWPGKKVILVPEWTVGISWDTRQVRFDMNKATLKGAPEYEPSKPINREYETVLYDYYGRPHYWAKSEYQAAGK